MNPQGVNAIGVNSKLAATNSTPLDFSPAPGAVNRSALIVNQARFELGLMLSNGEQLLLTLIIPVVLLVGLTTLDLINIATTTSRVNVVTPGILAVAVMASAFTAQAIGTGFDRRYGVLKLLGASPLTRFDLIAAKTLAVFAIEALQVLAISAAALLLGWSPTGNLLAAGVLLLVGTATFSALGLALAGLLRAEATLAVANAIFVILLLAGGTVLPGDRGPQWLAALGQILPSGALGGGLRQVLLAVGPMPWTQLGVLVCWLIAGSTLAILTFKWDS